MLVDQLIEVNMVLNVFDLMGKVVIVIGCDIGLGQGMMLGLVQVGCDIVGINCKIFYDMVVQVLVLGCCFYVIQVDFS